MLIDVLAPALDSCYDFEIDGRLQTEKAVDEIISLIEKKERIVCKDRKDRYLYASGGECLLEREKSLEEQGIKSGDRLILI